jgi:hypothetical protein
MLDFCQNFKFKNHEKLLKLFLILVAFIGAGTSIYAQGNTTSSINGVVYDSESESLPGASVLLTHVSSGTRYTFD